ncbi:cysteine proteinase [Abortiporus biennis]|nr:cysteine proteinase [Abortiporus biennis]
MAGSKRQKLKKMLSPSSPPPPPMDSASNDDELMDDLFAHLDSQDQSVQKESANVLKEIHVQDVQQGTERSKKTDSKARHKARQARKAAALAEKFAPDDAESDARIQKEAEEEKTILTRICEQQNLVLHEIIPDGHCLFSAIADQLLVLGILPQSAATYITVRRAAADYIQSHPDDFLPFLPSSSGEDGVGSLDAGIMSLAGFEKYCATIRNTGAWGGEPEILALSRAYGVPIYVVQSGTPNIVRHDPSEAPSEHKDGRIVWISYHRRMYGLGEHYNSLRPKSYNSFTNGLKSLLHP